METEGRTGREYEFANSSTVCTVLENRSRDVCICKINMAQLSTIEVYLLSDCHSYIETMMLLESLAPDEVSWWINTTKGLKCLIVNLFRSY